MSCGNMIQVMKYLAVEIETSDRCLKFCENILGAIQKVCHPKNPNSWHPSPLSPFVTVWLDSPPPFVLTRN